jgi:peptidoglycan/LPS O-acetylase OafA/YrhL
MSMNLASLDALRGLLACYVVVGHARWLLWAGHAAWVTQAHTFWENLLAYGSAAFRYGHEAVMIFFVLSGFFIHLRAAGPLRAGSPPAVTAGTFYRRRIHRLLAPYLFALIVTVVCDMAGRGLFPVLYEARTGDSLLDQNFARKGYGFDSVLPALVLVPSAAGRDFGSNGPLWSIAYEVVYYALYPAWLALRQKSAVAAYMGVPAVSLAASLGGLGGFPASVIMHYPVWLAGAGLAECLVRARLSSRIALVAAIAFPCAFALNQMSGATILKVLTAALFGCAAVICFAAAPRRIFTSLAGRTLEQIGIRSYTLYIVHFPLLALIAAAVIQHTGSRPLSGWLALTGALTAVGFGWLCFQVCERYFIHPRVSLSIPHLEEPTAIENEA